MELHQTAHTRLEINPEGVTERNSPQSFTLTKEVKQLDPGNPWDHLSPAQIPSLQILSEPRVFGSCTSNTCKTLPRTRSRSAPENYWTTRQALKRRIKGAEGEASLRAASGPAIAVLGHRARPAQLVHGSHSAPLLPASRGGQRFGASSANPS